jgi:NAD(P)-dependent dehydrogenase (short-subunit alcohol dehydrogenase family)
MTSIANSAVLITGGNRGIGRALVEEALARGAARVYAGMRQPLEHPDARVTPLILDITSPEQIQEAADQVESLDILVNNAGVFLYDDLSDRAIGSIAALAPIPLTPAYSVSKAAAFNLAQSLRILLARRGVRVHSVLSGPVDTDMVRDLDIPKSSPESDARAIFDGIDDGEEDIFPDPFSQALAEGWRTGVAKALERQNAALLDAASVVE